MNDQPNARDEGEHHAARLPSRGPESHVRDTPPMGHRDRAKHAMLLFLCYFMVLGGRGHGIFPVGLMLVFPEFPLPPRITGWIGTGLLALAVLIGNMHAYRIVTLGGIVLCCCSILLASVETDLPIFTWILSIPFAGYAWSWMQKAGWRVRSDS